ncbi:hypothetical protein BgiMline_032616, partial [Biomphalaria glabrata]
QMSIPVATELPPLTGVLNLTKIDAMLYTGVFASFGSLSGLFTILFLLLTYITSTRENMKFSEKILVYNVLISDLIYEIIVLTILCPSIRQNEWTFNEFKTTWIAFISTACMFHSQLALVFICDLIVLSLTDSYRFHASDNIRHMSALVLSTLCLSICICSLPACEQAGYIFRQEWLAPSFNLRHQYGSMFMVSTMYSLILSKQAVNLLKMSRVRTFFINNSSKITSRALKDLELLILFDVFIALYNVATLPAVIGGMAFKVTLFLEVIVIVGPMVRVILLYFLCPHFHFGTASSGDDYMDEYAMISAEDNDVLKLELMSKEGAPTTTSV